MATKILLKKSTTGGSSPLVADLDQGELAVNLVDKKIYTKDAGNAITRLDGAYVDSVAPSNPVEGDLWYDTANNLLKAYDGSAFQSAGYQTLGALEDVTLTSIASGDHLTWNGSAFVNSNLETDVEGFFSAANTGTGHGDLSYANGVFTFDRVTAAEIRGEVSVTDAGGDGSMSYDSATGVFTYTGPSAAEARAHLSAGTGVTYNSTTGEISVGQAVETTSDVVFNNVDVDGTLTVADPIITLHDANTSTPSGNGGIEIYRGGTQDAQRLIWNETADKWEFVAEDGTTYQTVKAASFEGPLAGAITGDVTGDVKASNGTVVLSNGTDGTDATFTGDVTGQVSDVSNHTTADIAEDPSATTTSGTAYFTDARARGAVSVTDAGGDGSLAYNSTTGVITYTGPSAAEARAHVSAVDAGGDGSFSYDSGTGAFTYTGPSHAEAIAHHTAGTGVTLTDNGTVQTIAIGQEVETTSDVVFNSVQTDTITGGSVITIDPATVGDATGEVVIAGDLTVQGTTTTVNSNQVNIGDSIILLNSDETGAPSQNGGIEIERGTAANKLFVWNETDDAWDLQDETLQGVVIDGGTY